MVNYYYSIRSQVIPVMNLSVHWNIHYQNHSSIIKSFCSAASLRITSKIRISYLSSIQSVRIFSSSNIISSLLPSPKTPLLLLPVLDVLSVSDHVFLLILISLHKNQNLLIRFVVTVQYKDFVIVTCYLLLNHSLLVLSLFLLLGNWSFFRDISLTTLILTKKTNYFIGLPSMLLIQILYLDLNFLSFVFDIFIIIDNFWIVNIFFDFFIITYFYAVKECIYVFIHRKKKGICHLSIKFPSFFFIFLMFIFYSISSDNS